ncbi:hypothetical protein NKJ40_07365 [Mesorhizobium sp. M0119]|uniref:hypothetical protein n=1 Tax=unclassified Mesorhizobium TaxID=325217 RepID=UPI0033395C78
MPDTWTINRSLKGCFILSSATLQRIYNHVEKATGKAPTVHATFANQRAVHVETLQSVLDDSSVSLTPIDSISISSGTLDQPYVSVRTSHYDDGPISIEIRGEKERAIALEEALVNESVAAKAWYSGLNLNGYGVGPAFFAIIVLLSLAISLLLLWMFPIVFYKAPALFYIIMAIGMFGFPWLTRRVFPSMVYDFGIGEKRFNRSKAFAGLFFGAIILGVAVNLLSSYLGKAFHIE